MVELSKSKVNIISGIAILMAVYFIFCVPLRFDESQNIVIKKLSGLSGFVEKEGQLRIDAGKKLIDLSKTPENANAPRDLKIIAETILAGAKKELKNPKLKGAGEKLQKAGTALLKLSETTGSLNTKLLNEKAQGLLAAGTKMTKKSARLMKMVSLRMYLSSYWKGLVVFGGLILILLVFAMRRNEPWAFPSMVTILSLPSIGGFYISLAGAVFFGVAAGFVPFVIGLIFFWAVVLIGFDSTKEKIIYFIVFTLLGMIGTDAFSFAEHGIRGILAMPYAATATDPAQSILRFSGPIALLTLIAVLTAIYKLAARKPIGWYFAMLSGMGIITLGFPVDWLRPKDSFFIFGLKLSTYFFGGVLGLILVVILLLPYFKRELLPEK